jgi:hypothetical protein
VVTGPLFIASVSLLMSSPQHAAAAGAAQADPPPAAASAAPQSGPPDWASSFAAAEAWGRGRQGRVSIALVDDRGGVHRYHAARHYHSASVVKAMLLVGYLNRHHVRSHRLGRHSRALLRPMIERSDNNAATRVFRIVGNRGLERVARRAGMQHFATSYEWGSTHIAAGDQARFFARIDRLVPRRHRRYERHLLSHIIRPQRWGVPHAVRGRARMFFKGGWRPERGGWVVHQVALVERGGRRVALAVLTDHDPGFTYGTETVEGVARRALRPLFR